MLLVVAHTRDARRSLRNVSRAHEETVVGRFGRATLFEATEFGGFLAVRLREKHGTAIQVERTRAFNEFETLDDAVREAALAYEAREEPATPYEKFAVGRDLPRKERMEGREL